MPEPIHLSTTSFNEAQRCLAKFNYHQNEHLVLHPRGTKHAVRRGIFIHRALEAYHRNESILEALRPMAEWAVENGVERDAIDAVLKETGVVMQGYINYWKNERWETIATERKVVVGENHSLQATIDLVVKNRHGKWIVEHKSTTDIPPATWRGIDPQTALQFAAAELSGDDDLKDIDGILFNYLNTNDPPIPRFKQDYDLYANTSVTTSGGWGKGVDQPIERKGKDPLPSPVSKAHADMTIGDDTYLKKLQEWQAQFVSDGKFYQRFPVIRPAAAIWETVQDFKAVMEDIAAAQKRGHWRRQFDLMHCRKFCFYQELCSSEYMRGGIDQTLRGELFVIETPDIRAAGREVDG